MKSLIRRLMGTAPDKAHETGGPQGWVDRSWTSADGLKLHARDYAGAAGDARTPIVCLHGLTRNASDFEDLAPHIAATGRRVLAINFRGRGASEWDLDPMHYLPATYAADVLALLDHAGVARAGFIGTSLGGIVSMLLASMRPTVIAGAVLNDVGVTLNAKGMARLGGYVGQTHDVATWRQASQYAAKINGAAFPGYTESQWHAFGRRLFEPAPTGGFRLAYDPAIALPFAALDPSAPPVDMTPLFVALSTGRPTLLIRGALSDILDENCVFAMRMIDPLLDVAEVPGVGHAPMLDEPVALTAIDAWLGRLP